MHSASFSRFISVLFLASLSTVPVAQAGQATVTAEPSLRVSLGAGLGTLSGNTLYHISSYDGAGNGVESELEFPLRTSLFGLEGAIIGKDGKGRDEFAVRLQWLTNIDNGSGQLQDSDWLSTSVDITLVGSAHPGLDIYSTSDITLKANLLDLRGSYNFWLAEHVAVGPLGGLLYQHFDYDAANLNQVGLGPYAASYSGTVAGRVLTYEATYFIPYLGVHAEGRLTDRFETVLDLGYSPLASAEDRDDHLLRHKLSEGSTSGNAYLAAASARWEFMDSNSLLFRWQYLKIDTTGTQTQTWYYAPNPDGVPAGFSIGGIADKITSEQTTLSLFLSHRF